MKEKMLVEQLGFVTEEGKSGIFRKSYQNNYFIAVDVEKNVIDFGGQIKVGEKKSQNITKPEDWVVLECVNRLLEKGYKPEDIILEKVYPTGHNTSGRLDILIYKGGKAFLMIECKTWGTAFEKEFKKIQKNGGQLFTYFQQDTHADFLMLYTSTLTKGEIQYKNEIIKIEDHYRNAGNVIDFYDRWNKVTEENGIFEDWVEAYDFENKALTKSKLIPLTEENSHRIFHEFLSILRKHSVSDKPNAFNKIFNLFLAKIFDEKKNDKEELEFQWLEKKDNHVEFQIRLINLYQEGMLEFLKKEVEGIRDEDFRHHSPEELAKIKKKWLKFNNVFALKEVIDDETFEDNARVLKEVVELLHKYQIRYPRKQQHLSDFFERLLTTGLKQESGQFFTPPPIARFIVRSLPFKKTIASKLKAGNRNELLPAVIDYAAGSGHFLTESMEEVQRLIDEADEAGLYDDVLKKLKSWKIDQFDWAKEYIYGIEKDYRLVKVAKVGCYFYGDGLAQVIHGDGLDDFKSNAYRGLLKENAHKARFDFVISNPPYSVSSFRGNMKHSEPEEDFELYPYLTDRSSEVECLFIERTKQLLREEGVAAVILPSSILSNTGIYTKTREILLKYFEFIAITELGSNTFMATGTNTVVLFLRRKNDEKWQSIKTYVDAFFAHPKDVTVNGVEKVFSKYVAHTWEDLAFEDYLSLVKGLPNAVMRKHELYKEYQKKVKAKNDGEKLKKILEIEAEKLLYFILAYPQKLVLVKTGDKKVEKNFLGYEFSNRRGHEGMHAIQRGKTIDECTKLFDPDVWDNPMKASTYILDAFEGDVDRGIDESLKHHVSRIDLVDTMTFDRVDFEKNINLRVKKKIKYEAIWQTDDLTELSEIAEIRKGTSITSAKIKEGNIPVVAGGQKLAYFHNESNREGNIITVSASGAYAGFVNYFSDPIFASDCNTIKSKNEKKISTKLLYEFLKNIQAEIYSLQRGQAQPHVYGDDLGKIKIPLPPPEVQEKIVKEIEELERLEGKIKKEVDKLENSISSVVSNNSKKEKLENIATLLKRGKSPKYGTSEVQIIKSGQARGFREFDFTEKYFVANEFILDERKLEKGDILINSSGVGTAGRVTLFDLEGDFVVDSHISILRLNESKALPNYVLYALANIGFKTIESMATGQSGQIELSLSTIQNIKIPLPPLPEQQKIVTKIEKIEAEIAKLQKELNAIPGKKEAILKKYL